MKQNAFEQDIFNATRGLALNPSLSRTLAHCLYWSQYATHWDGELPAIWKTGPELQQHLKIAARTANRHFKELAELGYWTISYRPRPGAIGKVTWLTISPRSLQLLKLAHTQAAARIAKRVNCKTSGGPKFHPLADTEPVSQTPQDVTSKQSYEPEKTAAKSFILAGDVAKVKMKEALSSKPSEAGESKHPKAPGYLKASAADLEFAAVVCSAWSAIGLKEWDWTSRFTWTHLGEVRQKFAKRGIEISDLEPFLQALLNEWHWIRTCMSSRYAHNDLNLHAPTPMALNHDFNVVSSKVLEKMSASPPSQKPSSLADSF